MVSNENPIGPEKPRQKRYWERADFWKDAGERVVTAFLWGCLSAMSLDQFTAAQISWQQIILGGGIGAVLSTVKAAIGAQRESSTTPVSLT